MGDALCSHLWSLEIQTTGAVIYPQLCFRMSVCNIITPTRLLYFAFFYITFTVCSVLIVSLNLSSISSNLIPLVDVFFVVLTSVFILFFWTFSVYFFIHFSPTPCGGSSTGSHSFAVFVCAKYTLSQLVGPLFSLRIQT